MDYRCVTTSVAGFVQQLAVCYMRRGYFFYVQGVIPAHKNPELTDRRIAERYDLRESKWTRRRRYCKGRAKVQYLRFDHQFVLVATHGEHPFFGREGRLIRDFRRTPLRILGYSLSCRPARNRATLHASVRIERRRFDEIRIQFRSWALPRSVEFLAGQFRSLPYEPYAPVRDQFRILLRDVNRRRKQAGLEAVPYAALRTRRRPVKPFGDACARPPHDGRQIYCSDSDTGSDRVCERTILETLNEGREKELDENR